MRPRNINRSCGGVKLEDGILLIRHTSLQIINIYYISGQTGLSVTVTVFKRWYEPDVDSEEL